MQSQVHPPDDERFGKWSVNFSTNPQGDVDKALMSLDEGEVTFTRKPTTVDPKLLAQLAGPYETPTGSKFQVVLSEDGNLTLIYPGQPDERLIPYKGLKFRIPEFSDVIFEFVVENGQVKSLKQRDASGGVHIHAEVSGGDPGRGLNWETVSGSFGARQEVANHPRGVRLVAEGTMSGRRTCE